MAGENDPLLQTHLPNPSLSHIIPTLDPKSLTTHQKPNLFQLPTEIFTIERGPRYNAYAKLREFEFNLRTKTQSRKPESELYLTPLRKQAKLQGTPFRERRKCSVLAQSVPNLTVAVRREKERRVETPVKTPKSSKKSGGAMVRKSFGTMKGFSRALTNI